MCSLASLRERRIVGVELELHAGGRREAFWEGNHKFVGRGKPAGLHDLRLGAICACLATGHERWFCEADSGLKAGVAIKTPQESVRVLC
jgi:hypothetical protein